MSQPLKVRPGLTLVFRCHRPRQSAGDDEFSNRENAYAYKRYFFRPRTLRPVGTISMESTILGGRIKTALPIYISPAVRPALSDACCAIPYA